MQKNENETSIRTCAFCGRDTKYWERVDQVPTAVCKQNFVLNHLEAKNGVGLQGNDYICTRHESVFELKYSCFKTSRPFQKGFSYNYVTEGTLCAICEDSFSTRRISRMSDGFQDFLLKGAYQRTTRSGTGLSEADSLCSSCYQSYRKKCITNPMKEKSIRQINDWAPEKENHWHLLQVKCHLQKEV
jgi:hypothetical protein